jgi:hypothetical protein
MERIASLIEQLQQALQTNADASQLLMLTNMLQAELQMQDQHLNKTSGTKNVAVLLPGSGKNVFFNQQSNNINTEPQVKVISEEKITEVLQVDEKEVEAELEEIRQKAEFSKKIQAQQVIHKPVLLFDDEPEIPTLIHQPKYQEPIAKKTNGEVNDKSKNDESSVNDRLKEEKKEVAHILTESSHIKDLKKAIGINDRFVFINELFRGDETMYERSIKTINNFSIYPEAQYWIERELKVKLGWDNDRPSTMEFYALVKRRFS